VDAATNQKKYIPRVHVRQDRWNKEQGNSNEGRTTRPHARTNAEKQEERRRTELEEETHTPRDTRLASRIYMRAKPSPGHVRKVRQAVSFRPMPFMRIGV
jgi:hypothetical protein